WRTTWTRRSPPRRTTRSRRSPRPPECECERERERGRLIPHWDLDRGLVSGADPMFPQLGMMEMIVVMGVAVLLFGKRLPEVGRSLGKGIVEFKKGLRGIEDEFDLTSLNSNSSRRGDDRTRTTPAAGSDYAAS